MEERIGHYSIVSELGRGGMGVVYKAHEESLNRFVALKVLGQHLSEDESYVQRFKREAQSAAALNHPNIVQVYSIDEFDGRHCFAMEYVQGASIQQMIKRQGPMDPVVAARLILQAASGLGAAHLQGIIHRDIKPANLMVDERGLVKITDFGLALLAAGATRLTATGMFMGTPGYLSPEQCLNEDVDQRADIYSLGVTFYEMLTGVTPFKADSPLALLRQIIDVEPKDVGELRPEVPEALRSILRKMMAKDRLERYADCEPLIEGLQSWLETAGGAGADLGAVVAVAAVTDSGAGGKAGVAGQDPSAPLQDLNTDPTLRVDSAQIADGRPPVPPLPATLATAPVHADETAEPEMVPAPVTERRTSGSGSKLIVGLAAAAAVVIALLTVTGYAAWRFGAIDTLKALITEPTTGTESVALADPDPSEPAIDVGGTSQQTTGRPPVEEPLTDGRGTTLENTEAATTSIVTEPAVPIEMDREPRGPLPSAGNSQPSDASSRSQTREEPARKETTIGTGVALISAGESLLAGVTSDFVRQALENRGVTVLDAMTVPGVAALVEGGDGEGQSVQEILKPYARYLVVIRADYTGDRELLYMGRYDREFQARLHLVAHDLLDGRPLGPGIHAPIGYTQLTVDRKVADLLRPKFRRIAGVVSAEN